MARHLDHRGAIRQPLDLLHFSCGSLRVSLRCRRLDGQRLLGKLAADGSQLDEKTLRAHRQSQRKGRVRSGVAYQWEVVRYRYDAVVHGHVSLAVGASSARDGARVCCRRHANGRKTGFAGLPSIHGVRSSFSGASRSQAPARWTAASVQSTSPGVMAAPPTNESAKTLRRRGRAKSVGSACDAAPQLSRGA